MRVGIVGAGTMGTVHAAAWVTTGADLVGVVAKNRASAQPLAEALGVTAYEDYQDLLATVDIVDVCAPSDLHKELVLQAAEAGKHVVCEKPIALTVEDGEAMIEACEQAGVRLFVGMVVRFFPQYLAAQRVVAADKIGDLGVMRLKRVSYQPIGDEGWFADEARSGGLLLDIMIHDLDYARWLGGEVKRVYARSIRAGEADAAGDYALVTLRFASGAMALVEGGWAYPPGVFRTSFDIAGSTGVLEWRSDDSEPVKTFLKDSEDHVARVGVPTSAVADDPFALELQHAYHGIVHDEPFSVTARDALEAVRIAQAARSSLAIGGAVTLEAG